MQRRRGSGHPAKRRRTTGRKARKTPTMAHVQQQVDALTRELKEEREQRKATSDLLNVISHSGVDLHTVLDALVESANVCVTPIMRGCSNEKMTSFSGSPASAMRPSCMHASRNITRPTWCRSTGAARLDEPH